MPAMTKAEEAAYFRRFLALVGHPIPPGACVLDFGCGDGALVAALDAEGFDAYGCDVVRPEPSSRLRAIHEDPYRLPFDAASFDCIVSQQVFEHVQDYPAAFAELRRVLKPEGVSLHIFPPPMRVREGHVFVPFAGVVQNRAWLALWARLGIRNQFQQGLPAREVTSLNHAFLREHTTYRTRRRVLKEARAVFPSARFAEVEMVTIQAPRAAPLARRVPALATLACELRMRALLLI